jgi:hypothetical protein
LFDDIQEDELMDQDDLEHHFNQNMDLDINADGLNGSNLQNVGFV